MKDRAAGAKLAGKKPAGRRGKSKKPSPSPQAAAESQALNRRLSEALLLIHQFSRREDFSLLKEKRFLDLCEIQDIQWEKGEGAVKDISLFSGLAGYDVSAGQNAPSGGGFPGQGRLDQTEAPGDRKEPACQRKGERIFRPHSFKQALHQLRRPISYKERDYGRLVFFSSQKISAAKRKFLKKISLCAASAIHFVENKEELEIRKSHWEAVFNSFHQALCITDKRFRALRANKAFAQLAGKSKGEIFGKSALEIFPFSLNRDLEGEASEGGGDGGAAGRFAGDSWIVHGEAQGRRLCWRVSAQGISLKNERLPLKLLLIEDISRQTQMEETLSRQARERELGFIKGSLAHELNNPLSGIKTLIHVIESSALPGGLGESPLVKENLEEIKQALDRCQLIIRKLLAASRNPEIRDLEAGDPEEYPKQKDALPS